MKCSIFATCSVIRILEIPSFFQNIPTKQCYSQITDSYSKFHVISCPLCQDTLKSDYHVLEDFCQI